MKMMISGRRGGKTFELLRLMHNNPKSVMVCFSLANAVQTKREAQQLYPSDYWEDRFVSIHHARESLSRLPYDTPVFVDNAEMVLEAALNHTIHVATATAEPL